MRALKQSAVWLAVALACVVLTSILTGCRTANPAAGVPSDQKTPVVVNADSRAVLMQGLSVDAQVLATALESSPESGSVIYLDHHGYVYDSGGNVVYHPVSKEPLRCSTKIVAKLNSLQGIEALAGAEEIDYEIGGRSYLPDLPDHLKHLDTTPVPLRLRVKGLASAGMTSHVAAAREAAAKERAAIYEGMAKLATARGAAFAIRAEAVAGGLVKVTTAAGELVGRVIAAKPLTAAGIAGRVIEAVIQGADGKQQTVVAQGDDATCIGDGCSVPVEWLSE